MVKRLLLGALALVACTHATEPSAGSDFASYALRTIDGAAVPKQIGTNLIAERGNIILRIDSTFVDVFVMCYYGTLVVDSVKGRFANRGDSLVFTSPQVSRYAMKLAGRELRGRWAEGLFVYRR